MSVIRDLCALARDRVPASADRILRAMELERALIRTRERERAIAELAAIPQPSVVIGLALDFGTDTRCEKAAYFGTAHGEPVDVECHAEPPHEVCVLCADKECANGCSEAPCPLCEESKLLCGLCDSWFFVCNRSVCHLDELDCCDDARRNLSTVCPSCMADLPQCGMCHTILCSDCDTRVECTARGCPHALHACADHVGDVLDDMEWRKCDNCDEYECEQCVMDDDYESDTECPGLFNHLCQACRSDPEVQKDVELEMVKRRKIEKPEPARA